MIVWICPELSCSILCVSIYDIWVKSYDHLNFSRASVGQFRVSRYIMYLNRTTEWKVMNIWISRVLPLFNFERLDALCVWIGPPSEKLWSFFFRACFYFSFIVICSMWGVPWEFVVRSFVLFGLATLFMVVHWQVVVMAVIGLVINDRGTVLMCCFFFFT